MSFSHSTSEEFEQYLTTLYEVFKGHPKSNSYEESNEELTKAHEYIEEIFNNLLTNIETHFKIFSSHSTEYKGFITSFGNYSSSFSNSGSTAWPQQRGEIINYGVLLCYGCALFTPTTSREIPTTLLNYIPKHFQNTKLYQTWLEYPVLISGIRTQETANQIAKIHTENLELQKDILEKKKALEKSFEDCTNNFKEIIKASFSELSKSFAIFKTRKKREILYSLFACGCLASFAISILAYTYFNNYWNLNVDLSNALTLLKTALPDNQALKNISLTATTNSTTDHLLSFTQKSIPIVTIEVLLIYFFRIALNNYYAARDELLQLEIREALCLFAPKYKAFVGEPRSTPNASHNETNGPLDEFAKHIFSPLNSRLNPTPHPLDFLGQVTEAVKKAK